MYRAQTYGGIKFHYCSSLFSERLTVEKFFLGVETAGTGFPAYVCSLSLLPALPFRFGVRDDSFFLAPLALQVKVDQQDHFEKFFQQRQ